jgi:hypothetical protein
MSGSANTLYGLASALHPSASRYRYLLMLKLYGDLSGKPHERVMAGSCFIATEADWQKFDGQWSRILLDLGADEFHATDFFGFHREFKRWNKDTVSRERHQRLAVRFAAVAGDMPHYGLSYAFDVPAFNRELAPTLQGFKTLKDRFHPHMFVVTNLLAKAADMPRPAGEQIAAVFEGEKGVGEAIEWLNWLKKKRHEPWTSAYVSFATAGKEILGIQGADLAAHLSWHTATDILAGTAMRPTRRQAVMARLLERGRFQLNIGNEPEFQRVAPLFAQFLQGHEGGLTNPPKRKR